MQSVELFWIIDLMKDRFLFYCKAPKPGYAKSRLAPFLGNSTAAELSAALTEYVLEQLLQHFCSVDSEVDFVVCYTGEENLSYWHDWLLPVFAQYFGSATMHDRRSVSFGHPFHLSFEEQTNGSLGDRLWYSFRNSFEKGAEKVVVVGIDTPDLDGFLVRTAFKALETFDIVVGPSLDGGYYLLGMRSFCEEVFKDIPWSTSEVLNTTRNQALTAGHTIDILPALEDIDEVENLFILERLAATTNNGKRWIKFLDKWLVEYLHPFPNSSHIHEALNNKRIEATLLSALNPRWIGEHINSQPTKKPTDSRSVNNFCCSIDTTSVYVSVVQPQLVGKLLRLLGKVLPLGKALSHVKRVKRETSRSILDQDGKRHRSEPLITVLLCLKEDFETLDSAVLDSLSEFGLEPFIMSIPARAATTREEYVALCSTWPVLYQPPPPPRPLPSNEEMLSMLRYMSICFDVAWHHRRKNTNYLNICAMMVRPSNDEIIAITCDLSCRSHISVQEEKEMKCEKCQPFTHAVMNCIESASWKVGSHKRRQSLQNKALSDCSSFGDESERSFTADSDSHSFDSETDTEATDKSLLPEDAYMCTGMDVYTTREPCLMCCMALVHARVKRVIFAIPNKCFGGLGGGPQGIQLHKVAALNHHFDVLQLEGFEKIWQPPPTMTNNTKV